MVRGLARQPVKINYSETESPTIGHNIQRGVAPWQQPQEIPMWLVRCARSIRPLTLALSWSGCAHGIDDPIRLTD
jgi:hypothetical protein